MNKPTILDQGLCWLISGLAMHVLLAQVHETRAFEETSSFWNSYAPGELLRNLDVLTLNEDWQTTTQATLPPDCTATPRKRSANIQARNDYSVEADDDVEDVDDVAAGSADNYDHAYEAFVKQYFDKSKDTSESSTEDQTEPLIAPLQVQLSDKKKSKMSKKNCKQVQEDEQSCVICKNPKNGEHSKTCTYQQATQPHNYAYEMGKKYENLRDIDYTEDSSDEVADSAEPADSKAVVTKAKTKDNTKVAKNNKSVRRNDDEESVCIKKSQQNKICFYCKSSRGEKFVKCFAEYSKPTAEPKKTNNTKAKRIYKRTVSYVYEQLSNNTVAGQTGTDKNVEMMKAKPIDKRKLLVKIVKKKLQI